MYLLCITMICLWISTIIWHFLNLTFEKYWVISLQESITTYISKEIHAQYNSSNFWKHTQTSWQFFRIYNYIHCHKDMEDELEKSMLNTFRCRWEGRKQHMIKQKKCLKKHMTKICCLVKSVLCPWGPKINKVKSGVELPKRKKHSSLKWNQGSLDQPQGRV